MKTFNQFIYERHIKNEGIMDYFKGSPSSGSSSGGFPLDRKKMKSGLVIKNSPSPSRKGHVIKSYSFGYSIPQQEAPKQLLEIVKQFQGKPANVLVTVPMIDSLSVKSSGIKGLVGSSAGKVGQLQGVLKAKTTQDGSVYVSLDFDMDQGKTHERVAEWEKLWQGANVDNFLPKNGPFAKQDIIIQK